MDDILNRIRVSREKEILADHEKTLNKALDYLASIESTDDKKIGRGPIPTFRQPHPV